jgi:hypothetical protein
LKRLRCLFTYPRRALRGRFTLASAASCLRFNLTLLALLGCGAPQTVELTGKLVISQLPADWCGSSNPDNIRLDCAFELGLYVVDMSGDGGPGKVLETTCVKLQADPNRKWSNLPEALNTAMARLDRIQQGTVRVELAAVEPPAGNNCAHDDSVARASLYGRSEVLSLMGTDLVKRVDIGTRCLKPFTPTAMCLP